VLPNVLRGELRQERLHSQRVELAECRDARSEDDVVPHLGHVLAVFEGEATTMGAIAPAPLRQVRRTVPAGRATDISTAHTLHGIEPGRTGPTRRSKLHLHSITGSTRIRHFESERVPNRRWRSPHHSSGRTRSA
jgi:hypothetical protein